MNDIDILTEKDDKDTYIRLDILYYCRRMSAYLLTNLKMQLDMVHGARILV